MKEIDFLPEWYKSGRRRQVNYRMQYIIFSGVFVVMMVWNFISANSLTNVRAKYMEMETKQEQSEKVSAKLEDFKVEINMLHEKEKLLDSIDSKIIVSNVLGEISYLVNERIVLSRVELVSEKIPDKPSKDKSLKSLSVVRSAGSSSVNNMQIGSLRFRVVVAGVAANGSDVAGFLCRFEDSSYFGHVDLSYSRDAEVKAVKSSLVNSAKDASMEAGLNQKSNNKSMENIQVSEFEITCYLSNYREY